VSLVKSKKLVEFETKNEVRVKSVDGSINETHGTIQTRIRE
jgi:hypothetical protein